MTPHHHALIIGAGHNTENRLNSPKGEIGIHGARRVGSLEGLWLFPRVG